MESKAVFFCGSFHKVLVSGPRKNPDNNTSNEYVFKGPSSIRFHFPLSQNLG